MAFQKAVKQKAKLRLALAGVSGAGKTYSALVLAKALGGKVALIDSERSSALLYADLFEFDHLDLSSHSIDQYKAAIRDAAKAGYTTLVIDSLSHEWAGRGGALEEVDRKKGSGNSFTAWNGVSQSHQSLLDDLLSWPGHIICTMRKKAEYVLEESVNRNGQKVQVPKKVGMQVVQREGIEFEFTAFLGLEQGGQVLVEKTRCPLLTERASTLRREDIAEVGVLMKAWLEQGATPASAAPSLALVPKPTPAPAPSTPQTEEEMKAQLQASIDMAPSKAPTQEEQVAILISEAQSEADLNKLVPRVTALKANPAFASLRAAWGARRDGFKKGGAA